METKTKFKIIFAVILALNIVVFIYLLINQGTVAILEPKGTIALKQKELMMYLLKIMLPVVLVVFALVAGIIFKYKEKNITQDYSPNLKETAPMAVFLWTISITVIGIVSVTIWKTSHELDPYKKIASNKPPMVIQVVALNWKWLFIYPKENIATINYIKFPKDTPIEFKLTAEAPMNTFWIPQLGGQMYAMAGMENQVNLMATEIGEFAGSATEINGKGYAGMRFKAVSAEEWDYNLWVNQVKQEAIPLTMVEYSELIKDSENNKPVFYSSAPDNLFDTIMMKYMVQHKSETKSQELNSKSY